MPHAPVGKDGAQFYYEDTGAPATVAEYTTLVLIHGAVFHSAIYRPLIPYATERGLRLILVNLRDYPGSTRYTASDVAALSGDSAQQRHMYDARGVEVAAFLLWLIKAENIPSIKGSGDGGGNSAGGFGLLAWSWGSTIAMSFLAQAHKLPKEGQETLGKHLRALIFLDSSSHTFGVPPDLTDFIMHPFRDPTVPLNLKGSSFERWVSSYYDNAIPPNAALHIYTSDELKRLLAHNAISDPLPEHVATADRLSAAQRAAVVDESVTARSQMAFVAVDQAVCGQIMQEALWDATVWPNLRVSAIWCDMSIPDTCVAAWHFARQLEDWPQGARKVELVRFHGANHFPQWDSPRRMVDILAGLL